MGSKKGDGKMADLKFDNYSFPIKIFKNKVNSDQLYFRHVVMPNCWTVYERVEGDPEGPTEEQLKEPIPSEFASSETETDVDALLPTESEYYDIGGYTKQWDKDFKEEEKEKAAK